MKMRLVIVPLFLVLWILPSRSHAQQLDVVYRVYLIGDTGGTNFPGDAPALQHLKTVLSAEGESSAAVFLGDNIYCCGMPDSASEKRSQAEMRIDEALMAVEDFAGETYFIPGNHDWGDAGDYSREKLRRQQEYVDDRLGEGSFLPRDGYPGPIEVKLTDEIRLIVIDTQWWLLDDQPFGDTGDYELEEKGDFLLELRDLLAKRDDEQVLVVGHHPLVSFGEHGGRFSLKDHLFPLTNLNENAWIPLPGIGSLYPVARSLFGGRQDLVNQTYRTLSESLIPLFSSHPGNLIYASGHEHSLQHVAIGKAHHLISGSGSRPAWVSETNSAFTSSEEGFMVLEYFNDGSVRLRAVNSMGDELHRADLFRASNTLVEEAEPGAAARERSVTSDSVTVAVVPSFAASGFKRAFWGNHHRDAWITPVSTEVFEIDSLFGGLKPLKRGGGLQTTSVRLLDSDGYQYVVRSVEKDPSKSIPVEFQKTIAQTIIKDQTSVLLPFSALMVPPLAKAAGIYYSIPKLYYVPFDPGFEQFADLVADQVMLFEQRPDDDMSAFPQYGNSEKVISAGKMFRELLDDNDNRVDGVFFARSRLFDMLLSDWDRHQDQWRWSTFDDPDGKGDLYRPIPRDRDWAFNRMNGFFPSIIKSQFVIPRFQDFRPKFGFIPGLNGNGMPQDRRFLSFLSEDQWVALAEDVSASIGDDALQEAVDGLPNEIKPLYEADFASTMKSRMNELPEVASEYYRILAKLVDLVGSDKHEMFTVVASRDSVIVTMTKINKKGEVLQDLDRRTFYADETEEIRLYGMGGNDRFSLRGTSTFPIRIYAIGGTGEDIFEDRTTQNVVRQNWFVRDTPTESTIQYGASTRNQLTSDPTIHAYSPYTYWFEVFLPSIVFASSQEDGLILGGGGTHTSYVYHRDPFSTTHTVSASIGTRSRAFTFKYDGWFNQRFGPWGLMAKARAKTQGNIQNFYGFGSNTKTPVSRSSYYESTMEDYHFDLGFFRDWDSGVHSELTSFYEFADVDQSKGGFATLAEAALPVGDFADQSHIGVSARLELDRRDNHVYPLSGFRWEASARSRIGIGDEAGDYTSMASKLSLYYTPGLGRKTTFATRFGVSHTTGDFPYFRSSSLGADSGLRGWRNDRFSGNTAVYQNVEVRRELFTFSTMLAIGRGGVNAYLDNGRVYSDADDAGSWHQGVGGGVWFNFFDMALLQISMNISEEETFLGTGLGFTF